MRNRGVTQGFKEVIDCIPKLAKSVPAAPGFWDLITPGLT
jgi:hypothetical protein